MAKTEQQSAKPITDDALDGMWDLDETANFEEVLGASASDPLGVDLDIDKVDDKTEVKDETPNPDKNIEELPDLDLDSIDDPKDESTEEESKEVKVENETPPELDLDTPQGEAETENENEFAIFAKLLAEKDLLDLGEDFEGTEQGLMEAFEKTIESRVQEEIDSFQGGLSNEGKELLRHLMNGGSVDSFQQVYSAPDIANLNITGDNTSNQKYILAEYMRLRGDSQEEIRETLEDYEDLGKLEKQAGRAKARLEQFYSQQKKQLAEKTKLEAENRENKRKEVITDISNKISDSVDIKGFPLTRKSKKDLLSYMTETKVKVDGPDGKPTFVTQFQADEMESSQNIDDFILRAYLRMTNFNLDPVKKRATSDYSSKLKKSLQNKSQLTDTQAKFGSGKKPVKTKSGASWDI
tara:strand:- start:11539 stop:12768 length:1230 start_codon:yes stop_codon:yes gene_type:complete